MMNFSEMSDGEIDATLAIQEGVIEACKGDTIRRSGEFWKAVEIKIKITKEIARQNRQSKS